MVHVVGVEVGLELGLELGLTVGFVDCIVVGTLVTGLRDGLRLEENDGGDVGDKHKYLISASRTSPLRAFTLRYAYDVYDANTNTPFAEESKVFRSVPKLPATLLP